jgi:hypothetical protein
MAYKIAQSNPAASTPANLYTVPSAKQAVISSLTICNHGTTGAAYSIWIRPLGATASDVHLLAFEINLLQNETAFVTAGIALATTDVITVEADTADVTFMAFINEVNA